MSDSKIIMTEEGRQKMQEELRFLKGTETIRLLENLKEARDKGNVSESSEFDVAKEQYELLQSKIIRMERKISNSIIVSESSIDLSKVCVLTTVTVKNKTFNKEMKFKIVPEDEIDLKMGKISLNSPIGKSLMNKKVGDVVDVKTPGGDVKLEIKKIDI